MFCFSTCFQFGGYIPRKGIAGVLMAILCLLFIEPPNFLPGMAVGFYAPGNPLLKMSILALRLDVVPP